MNHKDILNRIINWDINYLDRDFLDTKLTICTKLDITETDLENEFISADIVCDDDITCKLDINNWIYVAMSKIVKVYKIKILDYVRDMDISDYIKSKIAKLLNSVEYQIDANCVASTFCSIFDEFEFDDITKDVNIILKNI